MGFPERSGRTQWLNGRLVASGLDRHSANEPCRRFFAAQKASALPDVTIAYVYGHEMATRINQI